MPLPPPPKSNPQPTKPVDETVPEATVPDVQSVASDQTGTAALVQVAGLAVKLADQTGDERVKRIANAAVKEVQDSGVIRDMLKIVTSPSPTSGPTPMEQQREEDRLKRHQEFQKTLVESRNRRRQQTEKQTEITQRLAEVLLQKLAENTQATTQATPEASE